MTPILLLEVNEVPWRLIDHYLKDENFKNLRSFFGASAQYTTVTADVGELSPWVTWPTLHRGMNNEGHGILNLGQDPSTFRGQAIWDEIRHRGGSIGICGSMQSWPPRDPGVGGFYLPDTFAHDSTCIPSELEPFQDFNLGQVRENARVITNDVPKFLKAARVAASALRGGVRLRTLGRVAGQLVTERIDKDVVKRRPVFQTILFWDVFSRLFDSARPPSFSTFFTNHIAGVMHRYWHDVFPSDFGGVTGRVAPPASGQEPLMRFAMKVLDDMLGSAIAWAKMNPDLIVVFASSMGQEAVSRETHEGVEFVVEDLGRLMAAAGLSTTQYSQRLAMVPQVAVDVPDAQHRASALERLNGATAGGNHFIEAESVGTSLSITVGTPRRDVIARGVCCVAGRAVSWSELGVRAQEVAPGSAYHISEGSFAVFGQGVQARPECQGRSVVRSELVKEWLLRISQNGSIEAQRPPA